MVAIERGCATRGVEIVRKKEIDLQTIKNYSEFLTKVLPP
jgi:hypothetical protein